MPETAPAITAVSKSKSGLNIERLYASGLARCDLVLLHGWASGSDCWRPLLPGLRRWANVSLIELPGMGGRGPCLSLDELVEAVLCCCPPQAVLVGWSLGGQIATLVAAKAIEEQTSAQIAGLITLASNPHFVASDNWPGVPPEQLQQMRKAYIANPGRCMARFEALQGLNLGGGPRHRLSLAGIRGRGEAAAGLDWLMQLDTRHWLVNLPVPQLHLLAARDNVVPAVLESALRNLLSVRSTAQVSLLAEAGHALPVQLPEQVAQAVSCFLQQMGILRRSGPPRSAQLSKQAVARSFGRAAHSYDSVATLQRDVGQHLLTRLDAVEGERQHKCQGVSATAVLDLGCGTAYFRTALRERFPQAAYIGLDLSVGMLDFARSRRAVGGCWLAADAEQLPLAAASVDVVFSSLAIQWCQHPRNLFAELERVLKPDGRIYFSTLGPATLHELRSAWATVDAGIHVNRFITAEALQEAAVATSVGDLAITRDMLCLQYQSVRELTRELKNLGAHNVNSGRGQGLGGGRQLAAMVQAYEAFRQEGYLPASYEVYYGRIQKA